LLEANNGNKNSTASYAGTPERGPVVGEHPAREVCRTLDMRETNEGELRLLTAAELPQTLSYLAAAPLRNLILIGFLKSTGTCDDQTCFGFWKDGLQKGVGLLGTVAVWAGGAEVAQALGKKARESGTSQLNTVVGLTHEVEVFLHASHESRSGTTETHSLFVLRRGELKVPSTGDVTVRLANRGEFEELFRIHTDLYLELVGRPLPDPENSKQRLLLRIEAGRTWIACERNKIVFKADVATEIAEILLIEAVWTTPDLRGHGIGAKALSALCAHLLETYSMLCLSLLKDRSGLERFYTRIGFRYHGDDGDYAVVRY
jgi:predicted GNAT family acetyltransferase